MTKQTRNSNSADAPEGKESPVPALRPLESRQFILPKTSPDQEEQTVILLIDPEEITKNPVILTPITFALASLFDGKRTAREISALFEKRFEGKIPPETIQKLADELSVNLALLDEKFETEMRRVFLRFMSAPARPASHAGKSYAADAETLLRQAEGFFSAEEAPVLPPPSAAREHLAKAVVSPHVELRMGKATYAHAYKTIMEDSQADLFVILGCAHRAPGLSSFFISQRDYAVPGGAVKTERGLAARLQRVAGEDAALAELAHRNEFSVEFQAILLHALLKLRCKREFEIVPILCGPIEPFFKPVEDSARMDALRGFAAALREELDRSGRRWTIIAGVDWSHVGIKFGDSIPVDERILWRLERMDRNLLTRLEKLDGEFFYREIVRRENASRIDGCVAVLTMLEACRGLLNEGRLLHYGRMFERERGSAVSFAAMTFQ